MKCILYTQFQKKYNIMKKTYWEILFYNHVNEEHLKPYLKDELKLTIICAYDGYYQFPHKHPNEDIQWSITFSTTTKHNSYGLITRKCIKNMFLIDNDNSFFINKIQEHILRKDTTLPFDHEIINMNVVYYEIAPYTFIKKEHIPSKDITNWFIVIKDIPKTQNIKQYIQQIISKQLNSKMLKH